MTRSSSQPHLPFSYPFLLQAFEDLPIGSYSALTPEPLPGDIHIGSFLKLYSLNHAPTDILPRGLINKSNWCYVNSVLQSLVFCPALYNMMRSLDSYQEASLSRAPMLSSIVNFMANFQLPNTPGAARGEKTAKNSLVTGHSFEPTGVINMLLGLSGDNFTVEEGRMEDAEELLCCLLNGLSAELAEMMEQGEGQQEKIWQEVGASQKTPIQVSNKSL